MTPASDTIDPTERTRLQPRGSSQGGMRQYNERVVLQAIRLHGALPGAEIARVTQLTAQTVSLITKRLEADGLLLRGAPQRGKVGQPSVPLRLNPDGAVAVRYLRGGSLGSVEEGFLARLRRGDRFQFAGRTLELVRLEDMTAYVRVAKSGSGTVPKWSGGRMALSGTMR